METPRYDHPNPNAIFLGTHEHDGLDYDLYWSQEGGEPNVHARYGRAILNVVQGMNSTHPALHEARLRARRKGLPVQPPGVEVSPYPRVVLQFAGCHHPNDQLVVVASRLRCNFEVGEDDTVQIISIENPGDMSPEYLGDYISQLMRIFRDKQAQIVDLVKSQRPEMPMYQHDCPHCTFLGTYEYDNTHYDLYWCNQGGNYPTVIARYGDDGHNYTSSMHNKHPALYEARKRAGKKGLPIQHPTETLRGSPWTVLHFQGCETPKDHVVFKEIGLVVNLEVDATTSRIAGIDFDQPLDLQKLQEALDYVKDNLPHIATLVRIHRPGN